MADGTNSFLKEVDDALHEEKLRRFWDQWKNLIIGGVAALVLGTAAWQGWQAWVHYRTRAEAEQWYLLAQLPEDEPAKAIQLAELAEEGHGGFRTLAQFKLAENATPAEAARAYLSVAEDSANPAWLRQLARLNAALELLETDKAAARTQLETLQANPQSAAYPTALELLAALAMEEGDTPRARTLTEKLIALEGVPANMKQRALKRLGELSTLPQ